MRSLKPNRSSSSRTRIRPPSEVTRDPWNSTFNAGLKESRKGWVGVSPTAYAPPQRHHRVQTRTNKDVRHIPTVSSKWSNRKSRPTASISTRRSGSTRPAEAARLPKSLQHRLRVWPGTGLRDDGVRLNLHQHLRRDQPADLNHRGSRSDGAEEFGVGFGDLRPVVNVRQVDPRAHNISKR